VVTGCLKIANHNSFCKQQWKVNYLKIVRIGVMLALVGYPKLLFSCTVMMKNQLIESYKNCSLTN